MDPEILIIGGGVIGLSIAREMHKRGVAQITVVDKGTAGGEASWAAAGMLAPNAETHADDPIFELCSRSNALYPQFAKELLDETGIDIELDRTGTLDLAFTEEDANALADKAEWQARNGIAVEPLTREMVLGLEPNVSAEVLSGLRYADDGQVENRKLIAALRAYCEINGIDILENTEVTGLIIEGGTLEGVRTIDRELRADVTVIAAGAWASELGVEDFPIKPVKPIRGQMVSFDADKRTIGHVIYSPRGYIVPRADGRVLVGATVEDVGFRKEVTPDALQLLRTAAKEIAPVLADLDIKEAWAGLRPFAAGGTPVIGLVEGVENAFVATGHYRNGILLAPITAQLIADAIDRKQKPDRKEGLYGTRTPSALKAEA